MDPCKKIINDFYKTFPDMRRSFQQYLKKNCSCFDTQKDGFSHQLNWGLSPYVQELFEEKKHSVVQKILSFIEKNIGKNKELDETIEVYIFEDIIASIKGDDVDKKTHEWKTFSKMLGPKSLALCKKNEALWNELVDQPRSLGNMIRHLKEKEKEV